MTFRAGVVLACLGLIALSVVWLRTEKRRSRGTAARLEIRKFELETERWRLGREVAQRTNPAELRARALASGLDIEPDTAPDAKADSKPDTKADSRRAELRRGPAGPAKAGPPSPRRDARDSRDTESAVRSPPRPPARPTTAGLD